MAERIVMQWREFFCMQNSLEHHVHDKYYSARARSIHEALDCKAGFVSLGLDNSSTRL